MSRQSQREAVLHRLKQGPATTWQLGYGLGICCVTRRIFELRQEGYQILTTEQWWGRKRIVTYTLEGEKHEIQTAANEQAGTTEDGAQAVQAEPRIEAPNAHSARTEGMAEAAGLAELPLEGAA